MQIFPAVPRSPVPTRPPLGGLFVYSRVVLRLAALEPAMWEMTRDVGEDVCLLSVLEGESAIGSRFEELEERSHELAFSE